MRALAWALTKQLNGNAGGNTDPACEDTIELELSAEQRSALSRAETAARPHELQVAARERELTNVPQHPPFAWASVILFVLVVSGLSGAIAYLATTPEKPVHLNAQLAANPVVQPATPAPEPPPATPSEETAQVRIANPFDATEVFEFPSGTSETEARETVANLLLKRANDRQISSRIARQRRKTANQVAPVTSARFARRS